MNNIWLWFFLEIAATVAGVSIFVGAMMIYDWARGRF